VDADPQVRVAIDIAQGPLAYTTLARHFDNIAEPV
jgi:hypothetical protein